MTDAPPRFRPTSQLVEAKLHPPAPHPGTVDRTRLIDLLVAQPGPRVVSMIAPPGYGKTTLLAQWTAREQRPVAWLTLDDLDNDPAVLLSYLAVAFDRIEPIDGSIRSALAAPGQRILATAVPRLASELHGWGRPGVLVLDDAHRITDRTCLDALASLLDHLPPGFRVAIAGRSAPDLPLARLRAQRELLEIGTDLLALDELETRALAVATGYQLSTDQARALTVRTEGWAAGTYLAALAAERGHVAPEGSGSVSGRDHYIAAYLRSEFEHGLDEEDVAFLTRTAILETIAPPVAEAVSALAGARQRLHALAHDNLLIQETGTQGSYRYHNLLRDFLLAELERREPELVPTLHRRAATWYAAADNTALAIQHALASGDVDAAARIVSAAALPTFRGGQAATLDRWLQDFDTAALARYPPLAIIAGWIHFLSGRAAATDRMADIADRSTFTEPPADGSASFESDRAMLRAVMCRHGPEDMLANAELAVSEEGPQSPWRANALWLLGSGHLLTGDVDSADAAFNGAVVAAASASATATATATVALAKRGSIAMARGDWPAATAYARHSHDMLVAGHHDETLAALIVYAV